MRIEIPFTGSAYKSESLLLATQECVNFYPRPYPELGTDKMALFGTPGLVHWLTPGLIQEVRGELQYGAYLYVVIGNTLYRISNLLAVVTVGTILTSSGMVGIDTNGLDILIVDGANGYVYDLTAETLTQITDPDFPGGNNVIQVDGYYLVNKPGTGQIWRSDFNDGLNWNGLAFSTAGGDSDNIISLLSDHRDVWIIGEYSVEIWYNTGDATFNFARIEGAFLEIGGIAQFARCKANNAVYWLGRDRRGQGQVFQSIGHQPKVVSTFAIDYRISQLTTLSDAFMFSYQQLGHIFVVLTFPTDSVTLVYDSVTGLWHERASTITGAQKRWRINTHAVFNGLHVVGDYSNGKLYLMKTDVYDENGTEMIAVRTTPTFRSKQNRITVDEVHIMTEPGVGLITGDPEDVTPQGLFSWSRDGGRTFSAEVDTPLSLGAIGETENRSVATQLGQGVNWVFRFKISAAVKRVILGAYMEAEEDA